MPFLKGVPPRMEVKGIKRWKFEPSRRNIYGISTVWIRPLLLKPTVSFYIIKHRENLCNTGKTQGLSSWLECGHPEREHF